MGKAKSKNMNGPKTERHTRNTQSEHMNESTQQNMRTLVYIQYTQEGQDNKAELIRAG